GEKGDAIRFVERIERVTFLEAVQILEGGPAADGARPFAPAPRAPRPTPLRDPERDACLDLATAVYAARLPRAPAALAYCVARGFAPAMLARHRLGFVTGEELLPALRTHGMSVAAARRAGLLDRRGREFLAGRITIPEIRRGGTVWMTGRVCPDVEGVMPGGPRYLSLPGPK